MHAKVGIVGAGAVGTACAMALVSRAMCRDLVLVDIDEARAKGVVADLQYGAVAGPPISLTSGGYDELAGASLVVVTAGINEKAGGATDRSDPNGRIRLLKKNAEIYGAIIPKVVAAAPDAVILVVTDPPDPLTDVALRLSGHGRVISAGTFLDSLRFRFHIARRLGIAPNALDAMVLGEHGTSSVFVWSGVRVGGMPIEAVLGEPLTQGGREDIEKAVRFANIDIIEGIGASQHGIGLAVSRLTHMILADDRTIVPVGTFQADYGVTLSLPTVLGRGGAQRVISPALAAEERAGLARGAEVLHKALASV